MAKFAKMKQRVDGGKVATLKIPEVTPGAALHLRHASIARGAYRLELLRGVAASGENLRVKVDAAKDANALLGLLEITRELDYAIYAKTVLVGWEGIVDDEDQEVPFSVESAEEFLRALPEWLFDEIRVFALQKSNFDTDQPPPIPPEAVETLVKN